MRTISEPASASSLTWIAVPMASTVSVLVIDCTRTGASPPTVTMRAPQTTRAWRERRAPGRTAGSIGRQEGLVSQSSRFHLEACHAAGARERRQVKRLAAHLHIDRAEALARTITDSGSVRRQRRRFRRP